LCGRDRLRKRGAGDGLGARLMPVQRRFVPNFTLPVVHSEGFEMRFEILRVYLLESSGNSRVEKLVVRRQDALACDLADPVVGEVEAVSDPVENATPHEFLDPFSRAANAETSGDL